MKILLIILANLATIAKYSTGFYLLIQLFTGVKLSPPVWYYYPLLIALIISLHKIQNTFFSILVQRESDESAS